MEINPAIPELSSIAKINADPIWTGMEHTQNIFEIIYILRGKSHVKVKDKVYLGRTSDIFIMGPNESHCTMLDPDKNYSYIDIHFHFKNPGAFFTEITNENLARVPKEKRLMAKSILESILNHLMDEGELMKEVFNLRMLEVLLILKDGVTVPDKREDRSDKTQKVKWSQTISLVKDYVDKNYSKYITLKGIAEEAKISPFHLSHLFSREEGFSLRSYIAKVRLREAKKLLLETSLPISEIANRVGYSDPRYFTRLFRKITGLAPSKFSGPKRKKVQ